MTVSESINDDTIYRVLLQCLSFGYDTIYRDILQYEKSKRIDCGIIDRDMLQYQRSGDKLIKYWANSRLRVLVSETACPQICLCLATTAPLPSTAKIAITSDNHPIDAMPWSCIELDPVG